MVEWGCVYICTYSYWYWKVSEFIFITHQFPSGIEASSTFNSLTNSILSSSIEKSTRFKNFIETPNVVNYTIFYLVLFFLGRNLTRHCLCRFLYILTSIKYQLFNVPNMTLGLMDQGLAFMLLALGKWSLHWHI